MKLASIQNNKRDGQLVVVNKELTHAIAVPEIALTLQDALERWDICESKLERVSKALNQGTLSSAFAFHMDQALAPLPRAYQWLDGSVYFPHRSLLTRALGKEVIDNPREGLYMYQGASDHMIGCQQPIRLPTDQWAVDFEAEVGIITDDVPMNVSEEEAKSHIKLIVLLNDVSLRDVQAQEFKSGFGFLQSKPATSFSAVAVTPDELENHWDGSRLHLPIFSTLNGIRFGWPNAGQDMAYSYPEIISFASKSRFLTAGTIIGGGTITNTAYKNGSSCIAERRALETLEKGEAITPFMKFGDRIQIDMKDANGDSIFGEINQVLMPYKKA
ncbi:MAG: fumarylacetoacetate hydrolase family protein [Alphaproteobacteria bacterium]|nr:fumarylacetoacetate hydrolase family protein [Alphaproteobacteria bacterium]